jgi:hypothetical protein
MGSGTIGKRNTQPMVGQARAAHYKSLTRTPRTDWQVSPISRAERETCDGIGAPLRASGSLAALATGKHGRGRGRERTGKGPPESIRQPVRDFRLLRRSAGLVATLRQFAYLRAGLAGGLRERQQVQSAVTGAILPLIPVLVADRGRGCGKEFAAAAPSR